MDLNRLMKRAVAHAPYHLREDAQQEAAIGLWEAEQRYNGTASMETFAAYRMRGRVSDFLRREDPLSRDERAKVKAGTKDAPRHVQLDPLRPVPRRRKAHRTRRARFASPRHDASEGTASRDCRLLPG